MGPKGSKLYFSSEEFDSKVKADIGSNGEITLINQ